MSPPTVSAALAGRPISSRSLKPMAAAFSGAPTIPIVDSLVLGGVEGRRRRQVRLFPPLIRRIVLRQDSFNMIRV